MIFNLDDGKKGTNRVANTLTFSVLPNSGWTLMKKIADRICMWINTKNGKEVIRPNQSE